MPSISPTIGRRVWYYPSKLEREIGVLPFTLHGEGPLDAGIAHVWSDTLVNLSVADSNGVMHHRTDVAFIPDDSPAPADGNAYATWMPCQLGQAAKTEQAALVPMAASATAVSSAAPSAS
jgi:hypothetical protein